MNIPTDRIYKFLAVLGLLVMSGSIVFWLHDRTALEEQVAAAAGTAAAVAEAHSQLADKVQLARELQAAAEERLLDARRHYALGDDAAGDAATNESVARNSGAREHLEASERLLQELGSRKIDERHTAASAAVRNEGHKRLFLVLLFGFAVGLIVFALSCIAWWRETRSALLPEA